MAFFAEQAAAVGSLRWLGAKKVEIYKEYRDPDLNHEPRVIFVLNSNLASEMSGTLRKIR